MQKWILLPCLWMLITISTAWSQTDTSRVRLLNEVTIQSSSNKDQIGFYQSSKLATTEEILSKIEGVNLISRGQYAMEPTLRSYSANQINLSIDGMRIYGACTDKMDPVSVYVEPINLQGISVAHGAQGNYNGGSIGGNINLKFKSPNTLCHTQYLTQFVQSYSTNNQALSSSFVFEKSGKANGLRLSGTYRKANNYHSPDSVILYSAFEKLNFSASLQQVLDSNNQIRINYLGDWGRNIGYPALPMDVGKADAHIASISHIYTGKEGILKQSETKVYMNSIYHVMDDTHRAFVPMHMDMPSWSETKGAYNETSFKKNRHGLNLRIDAHVNKLRGDMTMYPNNSDPSMYMQTMPESYIKNAGLAFKYQFDVKANYFVKLNGRIDHYQQYALAALGSDQFIGFGFDITKAKKDWVKSLSLVNCITHKNNFSSSIIVGYAERIASSNERYGYYLFIPMDGYDYLGNPNLGLEKSLQLEYVIRQEGKKIQWSLQPFYHHSPNYIYTHIVEGYQAMTIGAKGVKTYYNISYAIQTGAEATLNWRIRDGLQYRSNLKYIYARTFDDKPLPLIAPLKLQQALRYNWEKTQLQLEYNFSAAQNRINLDFGERKSPAFHLINLRIAQSIAHKRNTFQLAFAVENLFNLRYHDHLDIGYVPRMGRNFSFTFGYILR
jgi:iron complex outermembrane receptor protein